MGVCADVLALFLSPLKVKTKAQPKPSKQDSTAPVLNGGSKLAATRARRGEDRDGGGGAREGEQSEVEGTFWGWMDGTSGWGALSLSKLVL